MTPNDNMPTPLNKQVINECLRSSGFEIDVHVLKTVESTNTWLLEEQISSPVTLCAAEHQTVGRGRRGKTWHSPDSGVTFSMRFNLAAPVNRFNGLSLLVGAVVCDSLRQCGVADAMVKWPNDVLVNGSKLSGILIESRTTGSGSETALVIGIGVNYKRGSEARLIDQASTDLSTVCDQAGMPDRSELIADITQRLVPVVTADVPQALIGLASRWSDYDALSAATATAIVAGESIQGRASGIAENGNLQIETATGMHSVNSAEVTVRLDTKHS